jgi:hypothetical protein
VTFLKSIRFLPLTFTFAASLSFPGLNVPQAYAGDPGASLHDSFSPETTFNEQETAVAPLWMDCYAEGGNEPNENNNLYGYTEIKTGKRIPLFLPIDMYGKVRIEGDRAGYFWHNHSDIGAGGRLHLLSGSASLFLFAEGSVGRYSGGNMIRHTATLVQNKLTVLQNKIDRTWNAYQGVFEQSINIKYGIGDPTQILGPIDSLKNALFALQSYIDTLTQQRDSIQCVTDSLMQIPAEDLVELRGGLVFWKGWGASECLPTNRTFPFHFWGDLYGEIILLSSQRGIYERDVSTGNYIPVSYKYLNAICFLSPKIGSVISDGPGGTLIGYTGGDFLIDTRGDWYNNKTSVEAGFRYKPFFSIDLSINAEYLLGTYLGRQRPDDENPNSRFFSDFRIHVSMWHGLGF